MFLAAKNCRKKLYTNNLPVYTNNLPVLQMLEKIQPKKGFTHQYLHRNFCFLRQSFCLISSEKYSFIPNPINQILRQKFGGYN